ncbi:MAG: cold shock domain-containing protein [Actinomycetota bacterium]
MSQRYATTDAPVFEGVRGGVVTDFDTHAGLGYVTDENGNVYLLHCINIADKSRDIAVGQRVEFCTVTRFGRAEAASVVKL